ncbi:hypothetical protein METHB2_710001 [Candidatus Methylobacter favarea]|uniref:PilZ domain-containing protein n=2 Tax=Candidatus Methylobacter favarea TaxID=2707345 RepID=A0A8S0YAS9_9GAMM|nr:hypothetical protein METHB2_710001 [Candidatus Methylobacter favarea]
MTRRDFVKPAFSLRKKRSVKTHALSLLGTTRLLSRSVSANESIIAYTRDLSDSGLFVIGSFRIAPSVGDVMEVVVLEIDNALPKPVVVKRVEPEAGIAVEFI